MGGMGGMGGIGMGGLLGGRTLRIFLEGDLAIFRGIFERVILEVFLDLFVFMPFIFTIGVPLFIFLIEIEERLGELFFPIYFFKSF